MLFSLVACTHTHAHIMLFSLSCTQTHTHACTQARTRTHTHAHTCFPPHTSKKKNTWFLSSIIIHYVQSLISLVVLACSPMPSLPRRMSCSLFEQHHDGLQFGKSMEKAKLVFDVYHQHYQLLVLQPLSTILHVFLHNGIFTWPLILVFPTLLNSCPWKSLISMVC